MKDIEQLERIVLGMSNFDGLIDDGLEEALKSQPGKVCAHHPAWNFLGYVWYEDGKFQEQIWQYNSPVEEIEADTLEELMKIANDKYGWE